MIVGQNTLLNQYVPTFLIKNLYDGQTLVYDSTRKAFINATGHGGSGASKLGELLNVSSTVDSPNPTLHTGQALVYNAFTSLWENTFVDYNTLLNKPPAGGSVTNVSVISSHGISSSVATSTTTPVITLSLGAITPTSVSAIGTIIGSNITGINTGDQIITLTGDVTGSGTGSFATTLATVPIAKGGTGQTTANLAFNALAPSQTGNIGKFLKTDGTNTFWAPGDGTGTVTSIGITVPSFLSVSPSTITTAGTFAVTLSGTALAIVNGGTGATSRIGAATNILPNQSGHNGQFLTTDGTNITWAIVSGSGTVTNVSVSATSDITGTVATSGTTPAISLSLTPTGVSLGTYGSSTQVPVFNVDANGRIHSVTNTPISGSGSAAPEVVVFHYSSGSAGNFAIAGALFSQTTGVTTTITDAANCIATYAFTGKVNPPKSILLYGQNFVANTFSIVGMPGYSAAAANINIAGGGTSASPDLANGIFSASNVVTLQTRMADTGASSTLGNRAWLVVVFGF